MAPPPIDSEQLAEEMRRSDEPPDSWQLGPRQFDSGLGLEVVPTDLSHFAAMVDSDSTYFGEQTDQALNGMGQRFPNFLGMPLQSVSELSGGDDIAGSMAEGQAFQSTYLRWWGLMQGRLAGLIGGLGHLSMGAGLIHAAYGVGDAFGGEGFAAYDAGLVGSAFIPPPVEQGGGDRSAEADSIWQDQLDDPRGGPTYSYDDEGRMIPVPAYGYQTPLLVSDADPGRESEVRIESGPGAYTLADDEEQVTEVDQAEYGRVDELAPAEYDEDAGVSFDQEMPDPAGITVER
jgi:hypothetical protein